MKRNIKMKKIAALLPVHRRPDLLIMQLENYNKYSNYACLHILHISKEGSGNFTNSDIDLLMNKGGAVFTSYSNGTSWITCIGALIACSEKISEHKFDYVYMHTDGDMLVSGDLQKHIYENKLGYSAISISKATGWVHYSKMVDDLRFKNLLNSLNIPFDDIVYGRQEGSFYPTKLWLQIISKISEYYDAEFFDDSTLHWPIEEAVIPTLAKYYTDSSDHVANVVLTKEWVTPDGRDNPVNCIMLDDLTGYINNARGQCLAVKWFSQDKEDPARIFLTGVEYVQGDI